MSRPWAVFLEGLQGVEGIFKDGHVERAERDCDGSVSSQVSGGVSPDNGDGSVW